jgi:uncharacterized protein (DUF983 family)
MTIKSVKIDYGGKHDPPGKFERVSNWESDPDTHCPHCGQKQVWTDQGPADYYVGRQHVCSACGHGFTMQDSSVGVEVVLQLRA